MYFEILLLLAIRRVGLLSDALQHIRLPLFFPFVGSGDMVGKTDSKYHMSPTTIPFATNHEWRKTPM